MLLMFEKGIWGEITQAVTRYAKANNKYMKDLYNPDEESIHLEYLDANNLYGWAMVQNLPTQRFLWKKGETFTPEKKMKLSKKTRGNIFWRLMWSIQKGCTKITISCHF